MPYFSGLLINIKSFNGNAKGITNHSDAGQFEQKPTWQHIT